MPCTIPELTVNVPDDFPSVMCAIVQNTAIAAHTKVTIVVASDHLLSESVYLVGGDYSNFRIVSDAMIGVAPSFNPADDLFNGDNCVMPRLECEIDAQGLGRHGVYLENSRMTIAGGIRNAGYFGLYANKGSHVTAHNTYWRGAGASGSPQAVVDATGISARRGSIVDCAGADVSESLRYGISASQASVVNFTNGIARTCARHNIRADEGAVLTCTNAVARDAGVVGIYAWRGSIINADGADIAKNAAGTTQKAFYAVDGSTINARNGNGLYAGVGFEVLRGSVINAHGASGTRSQSVNTLTRHGVIYQ